MTHNPGYVNYVIAHNMDLGIIPHSPRVCNGGKGAA